MDNSMSPKVVTTLRSTERNFTFHVTAYRKLSEKEMHIALNAWMAQNKLKNIPRNKVINYVMTVGFDE